MLSNGMRFRRFRRVAFCAALLPSVALARPRSPAASSVPAAVADENGKIWSAAEVVIDLYPATDSVFATNSLRLSWHESENARRYRVQLAADGDFRQVLVDRTTADREVATGLLRPGRYFWRVAAIDARGAPADWSTVSDFEIRAGSTAAVTLHWRPPTFDAARFSVRVARDAAMKDLAFEKTTENAFFVTDPLPRGRYFWRVDTLDVDGKKLESTPVKSFTVGDGGIVVHEGG